MRTRHILVGIASMAWAASPAFCDEAASDKAKSLHLRLFNTGVFGKHTTEPVVLLVPRHPGDLDPETVMVDVSDGQYYAATVRYPTTISFEDARQSLNSVYKKWEKKSFANDPDMGIWRNEDDKFSVQLSQDGFTITVIYIKFSMLTDEKLDQSITRVGKLMEDEENAKRAIASMHGILKKGDFEAFYRTQCHAQFRRQIDEPKFLQLMRSGQGKKVVKLFKSIENAIVNDKDGKSLVSRFNQRDAREYEFVLVPVQRQPEPNLLSHLVLRREGEAWKLKNYD